MERVTLTLEGTEARRLDALAARWQMGRREAAAHLLRAAVDALAQEERFEWPLFLTQARPVSDVCARPVPVECAIPKRSAEPN